MVNHSGKDGRLMKTKRKSKKQKKKSIQKAIQRLPVATMNYFQMDKFICDVDACMGFAYELHKIK